MSKDTSEKCKCPGCGAEEVSRYEQFGLARFTFDCLGGGFYHPNGSVTYDTPTTTCLLRQLSQRDATIERLQEIVDGYKQLADKALGRIEAAEQARQEATPGAIT